MENVYVGTTKMAQSRLWIQCPCGFTATTAKELVKNGFLRTGKCPECGKVL